MAEGREPLHQAAALIGDQDMLLVLDRFDHLLEARSDLAHLLQACPKLVILLTSRVRLGMAGEWAFRLGGLDAPPAEMDASINAYSAANLFLHAAQQARPDLTVDDVNRAAVAEICRLVQGLPLGLVLLAAWVRVLPCVELLEELRRSIDVVRGANPTGDAQQISLRSVLEQSWHSLRAEERSVLAALSVFHGGFDRKAAGLVADADLDVLSSLVDHSLLHVSGEGRYSWHELVQQFCAEKLESSGQQQHMAGRHFAYFLAEAENNAADLASLRNLAAFLWFGCERANLQAAVEWASSSPTGAVVHDHKRLVAAIDRAGYRKGVHITL
jgi:predicted ATPase